MSFSRSEKIYLKAEFHNWDYGPDLLKKLLLDKDCDKATALLIYWRSDPGFYYAYPTEAEIPEWSVQGYQLMKAVEELILKDNFPERISYEPDLDRIPKDNNILTKIPAKLLLPSIGKSDSAVLVNQFYYGTLLIDACEKGDLEEIKEIIDKRPDCINVCIDTATPIHTAIKKNKVLEYLIAKGADIHHPGDEDFDMQPIHSAALVGKNTAIKTLLQNGVNINAPTTIRRRTPLHIILGIGNEFHWNKYKLLSTLTLLLKNGADLTMEDAAGKTPIELAKENENKAALKIMEQYAEKK